MHSGAIDRFNDDTVHMNYLVEESYGIVNTWYRDTRSEDVQVQFFMESVPAPKNWFMQGFSSK